MIAQFPRPATLGIVPALVLANAACGSSADAGTANEEVAEPSDTVREWQAGYDLAFFCGDLPSTEKGDPREDVLLERVEVASGTTVALPVCPGSSLPGDI